MNDATPPAAHARSSLAVRIALASALFGLIVATGAIAVGFWALSRQLDERAALVLEGRQKLLAHVLTTFSPGVATRAFEARFDELFFGHDDLHLALVEPGTGRMIASSSEIARQSSTFLRHAAAPEGAMHSWVTSNGERFSGLHGTAVIAGGERLRFYLSVERARDAALLAGFVKATLLALPLLLLAVALGAGLIARTGLAPLRNLNRLAASVGAKSLSQRLSIARLPRELADLAGEFNRMLARLDEGYRQLEAFSSDLAHEMRTPVATLLGRSQVALSRSRSTAQLREVLEGNVEELERLSALIGDMLFIAQADHDAFRIVTEPVDLSREVHKVTEFLSVIAEDKGVRLEITGGAPPLQADPLLIQRAITNLVSNAIRHARPDSTVTIALAAANGTTTVAMTNEGDPIAPQHLRRIFDRFYRVDPARTRRDGGSGLGLAIVRSIAALHGGTVSVRSDGGTTTFTLAFPQAPQAGVAQP